MSQKTAKHARRQARQAVTALMPLTDRQVGARAASIAIDILEKRLTFGDLPPCEIETSHIFAPGARAGEFIYARQVYMPKATILTSAIHKTQHIFIVSKGKCVVSTPGGGTKRIEAPYTGITEPGTRRAIWIEEDTVWTTFHPTDKTDPEAIIRDITLDYDNAHVLTPEEKAGMDAFIEKLKSTNENLTRKELDAVPAAGHNHLKL